MEVVAVVSQCHSVFGVVSTWSAFTQNALWSRDASLNARAYQRARAHEVAALKKSNENGSNTSISLSAQVLQEMQSRARIKALETYMNREETSALEIFPT
jgi:hypothetical protein